MIMVLSHSYIIGMNQYPARIKVVKRKGMIMRRGQMV